MKVLIAFNFLDQRTMFDYPFAHTAVLSPSDFFLPSHLTLDALTHLVYGDKTNPHSEINRMGFYIRKAFSFGPLRLNLSRSGLGASFGVPGARIGIGPRGSYIQMGRGGLYYRQTLHSARPIPEPLSLETQNPAPLRPASFDGLQEVSSASAIGMVDSSAAHLLQELNRVKRRIDLFPLVVSVCLLLSVRLVFLSFQSWLWLCGLPAIVGLALLARNNDVTNGTAILNYSFEGTSGQSFSELQNAFAKLVGCSAVWHVEAEATTADWKRHAGASYLERRSNIRPTSSRPPKVECNIDVPTLSTGQKSLYFFPDRMLVYDSSGVGAVSYTELNAQSRPDRFVEEDSVPSDAQQVGTTWRFVARSGGPDRRFNNNRQLPILLYGKLSLSSASGLNELFQYPVPDTGSAFAATIDKLRAANPTAAYNANESADQSSASKGTTTRALLWISLGMMTALLVFLSWPLLSFYTAETQKAQEEELAKQDQARRGFADGLNHRFLAKNKIATAASVNANLTIQFSKEGPKAARRHGIEPFVKDTFFKQVFQPDTEKTLCDLGFRTLSITRNSGAPQIISLNCVGVP